MKKNKKVLITSLLANLLLVFTFFIFGPLEMYLTNINDLWFGLENLLPVVLFTAVIVFFVLAAFTFLLPEKASLWYTALIWGLGLAFYIQGNFMQIQYGILDGKDIDWASYSTWGIINTLIWVVILVIPFILLVAKKEWFQKIVSWGSSFIVAIQAVTLIVLLLTTNLSKANDFYVSANNIYTLTKEKNIVVFVLDTFDADHMTQILDAYPEYSDTFQDFTFYDNASGMYPTTRGSLPYLVTGIPYKNEVEFTDYVNDAYSKTPVLSELKKHDYNIGLYTGPEFIGSNSLDYFDNIEEGSLSISSQTEFMTLVTKFTAIKYFPHELKRFFWIYSGDFNTIKTVNSSEKKEPYSYLDSDFYSDLVTEKISIGEGSGTFRMYHLLGAHPPYIYDENLNKAKEGEQFKGIQHWRGNLKNVSEYIQQLRQLGIYDQTMIVVLADHGLQTLNLGANPIFMIKEWDQNQSFSISHAPISWADFPPTILQAVTGTLEYGKTIHSWEESSSRTRSFYNYAWDTASSDLYFPDIFEYEIVGLAGDITSFHRVGVQYTSQGKSHIDMSYKLGTELVFSSDHTDAWFFLYGLSTAEGKFTRSVGNEAKMLLDIQDLPNHDLELTLDFSIYAGKTDTQQLIVFANGTEIGNKSFSEADSSASFIIPQSLLATSQIDITFQFPDAISPLELNRSTDIRQLSFSLYSITVDVTQ